MRYRLPIAVRAAHSQSKRLGRVRGDVERKGNATKASGSRNRRWIERCRRGSSVP
jgi:ribosomal protein L19E